MTFCHSFFATICAQWREGRRQVDSSLQEKETLAIFDDDGSQQTDNDLEISVIQTIAFGLANTKSNYTCAKHMK